MHNRYYNSISGKKNMVITEEILDELSEIMRKYKGHLDVYDRYYKYALNKQNGDAALNREYLLVGYDVVREADGNG